MREEGREEGRVIARARGTGRGQGTRSRDNGRGATWHQHFPAQFNARTGRVGGWVGGWGGWVQHQRDAASTLSPDTCYCSRGGPHRKNIGPRILKVGLIQNKHWVRGYIKFLGGRGYVLNIRLSESRKHKRKNIFIPSPM